MFSRVPQVAQAIAALTLLAACGDAARSPGTGCDTPECDTTPCTPPDCGVVAPEVGALGQYSSAVMLPDGRLAVATWDSTHGDLVVALGRPGSPPSLHVVAGRADTGRAETNAGRFARIALESTGALQIAWFDADAGAIFWARGDEAGFGPPERVDGGLGASGGAPAIRGTHLSLALDASDAPHLAYRDETARGLRYAIRTGRPEVPATPGMGWRTLPIDGCAGELGCPSEDEDYGEWAAIALSASGGGTTRPRIAFYDRLRGDLKMAALGDDGTNDETAWVTSTLDGRDLSTGLDTGDVGRHLSLAVTPMRGLGLAYFDASRGALRYLAPGEPPRIIDTGAIDAEGRRRRLTVGQYSSLAYDAQGGAHIVHVDATTPGLRHAVVLGSAPPTLHALPLPPGAWPSLAHVGDRLVGAYGAFERAPETRLELFDLPVEAPR